MCPENANVYVVEDNSEWKRIVAKEMEKGGHTIVAQDEKRESALQTVESLVAMGVQVVVLDGNVTEGMHDGSDGRLIAKAIKQAAPEVKIIGFSTAPVSGADLSLDKSSFEIMDLANAVTRI